MDGMIYTNVAKNLADERGSLWNLHFAKCFYSEYHAQPPLYLWLMAFFFKIFGSSIYVERLFSLLTYIITGFLIYKIWKLFNRNQPEYIVLCWLPLLFWAITPVTFWSYIHGVEETIMSNFVLLSAYFCLKGLIEKKSIIILIVLSGLSIFLSSFCKGIQGMFTLSIPFIYWLTFRKISFKQMFIYTLIMTFLVVGIYLILFMNHDVAHYFQEYYKERLVNTFTNKNIHTTENRLYLIYRLFTELIPVLIITLTILVISKKQGVIKLIDPNKKSAIFFILTGLSGSLPLIATMEQRGFYLTTSISFFSIGLAMLACPGVSFLISKINIEKKLFKALKIFGMLLLGTSLFLSIHYFGKTKRDHELIHDVHAISKIVSEGETIGINNSLWQNWSLHTYFVRHNYISLCLQKDMVNYFLIEKNDALVPENYEEINLNLQQFRLFRKK